jgi:hypothetical protein
LSKNIKKTIIIRQQIQGEENNRYYIYLFNSPKSFIEVTNKVQESKKGRGRFDLIKEVNQQSEI